MRYSAREFVDFVADGLEKYFDIRGLQWKAPLADVADFSPLRPRIFRGCIPPGELTESGWPMSVPSILVTVDQITGDEVREFHMSLHTCIKDAATTDSEKMTKFGAYYIPDPGRAWTPPGSDLYTQSVLLAEAALDALDVLAADKTESIRISGRTLIPPDSLMEYFPYSAGAITFTASGIPRPKGGYNDFL